MSIEKGETFLLGRDALQPNEQNQNEEGSHAKSQLQVAARDDLDGVDEGCIGSCLTLLEDFEHVDQHLVQFNEIGLFEVVP
jgi:hypothetical protein